MKIRLWFDQARLAMANELDVYLYGERVATVARRGRGLQLEYLPHYVARPEAVPISVQLPVVPRGHSGEVVNRFLENLLPDRPDVKRKWAQEAGLTSEQPFDLLAVYGADVAGALEFYRSGSRPSRDSNLAALSELEIGDRIRQIRADDSQWLARNRAEHAFSLGGAQGKFALALHEGQWFEPTGDHPSTHIFKPGVNGFAGSDVTEHITMQLARSLGIFAAHTEIGFFDGEHVLIVERFDRRRTDSAIVRLHQEDLAQATGTASLNKYEQDNGPSYLDIFGVFDRNLSPSARYEAKLRFAECLIFSWIVGHNDGHSKNYSLAHFAEGSSLAPFYDLNSMLPFQPDSAVRARDYRAFDGVELAFAVHGARALGDYSAETLRALELDAQLPQGALADFAGYVATNLVAHLNQIIGELPVQLQQLAAVKNFPFVLFAQTRRVLDVLTAAG